MLAKENAEYARADAALCSLASRCLLQPTMELAHDVQTGEILASFKALLSEHPRAEIQEALGLLQTFQEKTCGKELNDARLMLETDYNRLFVGPARLLAVPYESFYKTPRGENDRGRLRGPSEREVVAAYGEHGYTMPEHFVDFADHIAIELEFLAMLANDEAALWEAGDTEAAEKLRADAEAFRIEHPASFIGALADDIRTGAHREFYPAMANIVEVAILS